MKQYALSAMLPLEVGYLLISSEAEVSHGLVVSGADFYDTPTDLRLPDLGRNKKMAPSSCRLHMLCAEDGYAFCRIGYVGDDAFDF